MIRQKRTEKRVQHLNVELNKSNDKRGIYFNCTNRVKRTDHYATQFSTRNVFHISMKKQRGDDDDDDDDDSYVCHVFQYTNISTDVVLNNSQYP